MIVQVMWIVMVCVRTNRKNGQPAKWPEDGFNPGGTMYEDKINDTVHYYNCPEHRIDREKNLVLAVVEVYCYFWTRGEREKTTRFKATNRFLHTIQTSHICLSFIFSAPFPLFLPSKQKGAAYLHTDTIFLGIHTFSNLRCRIYEIKYLTMQNTHSRANHIRIPHNWTLFGQCGMHAYLPIPVDEAA